MGWIIINNNKKAIIMDYYKIYTKNIKSEYIINERLDINNDLEIFNKVSYGYFLNLLDDNINNFLPIGHFVSYIPRFFIKTEFVDIPEFYNILNISENDVIIGYDFRQVDTMKILFRLRLPKHKISKQKGVYKKYIIGEVCTSFDKFELVDIAKKLNITLPSGKINKIILCKLIRSELIKREKDEKLRNGNVKWFYNQFEKN